MAVVGGTEVRGWTRFQGLVHIWIEFEVISVTPAPWDLEDQADEVVPLRWAVYDARRQGAKDARPWVVVGLPAPRDNQLTTDPANINWNDMNGPQQAAYTGVSFDVVADDAVL